MSPLGFVAERDPLKRAFAEAVIERQEAIIEVRQQQLAASIVNTLGSAVKGG